MSEHPPLAAETLSRIAFLGDSITDGDTYPQLVRDSLAASKGIAVTSINAGIGGNTMAEMLARVRRDVLDHNPTLVTVSSGGNDAARGVTPEHYEAAMRETVAVLQAWGLPVILLTPCARKKDHPVHHVSDEYEAAVRRIAAEFDLRIAEVRRRMHAESEAGISQYSLDGHPGYQGQRSIAGAVMDALGYGDVPVVERVNAVMPDGIVRDWRVRPLAESEKDISDQAVAAIRPDNSWTSISVPISQTDYSVEDFDSLAWLDDARQRGMVIQLKKHAGDGAAFVSVATLTEPVPRQSILQTGAEVKSVWLNGEKMMVNEWTRGWHIGRDRTPISLRAGENVLVVESGENFWIRVADKPLW